MNMDGLLLHSGQWAPCVNPEEKWVLRIADLGRAPNRLRRARQKGPGKPVLMSGDGLWGGGGAQMRSWGEKVETMDGKKNGGPQRSCLRSEVQTRPGNKCMVGVGPQSQEEGSSGGVWL